MPVSPALVTHVLAMLFVKPSQPRMLSIPALSLTRSLQWCTV